MAGYANVVMAHGTAAPEADTADDACIYLKFDESGAADSGAKPDMTTTATPGLQTVSGAINVGQISTGTSTETDGAKPVLLTATGIEGSTSLLVTFSEPVYTTTGAPACGAGGNLTAADFGYSNDESGGATTINSIDTDDCAESGSYDVTLITDSGFAAADGDAAGSDDSIAPGTNAIYDAADNAATNSALTITVTTNDAPCVTSVTQTGTKTLVVVYSEAVDETSAKATGNYKLALGKTVSGNASDNSNFTGATASIAVSSITGSGTTYTLTFASDFASDTFYTLVFDRGEATNSYIKDTVGKALCETNTNTFFNDQTGPYIVNASAEACSTTTTMWVETSEEMFEETTYTNYDVNWVDNGGTCTVPNPSTTITSASKNADNKKDLTVGFNSVLCSGEFYKLRLKNPQDDGTYCGAQSCLQDAAGNTASDPSDYTFKVNRKLTVQNAQPVDSSITNYQYMVDVTFNKPVQQATAECSNATDCNKIYYISGLGNVTNATRLSSRVVRLTHTTAQVGRFYTIIVANGDTTDGKGWGNEDATKAVKSDSSCTSGETVDAYPFDRFAFQGSGAAVNTMDDYFFEDPFQDGAKFVFAFNYKGQVYIGPNDNNNVVFRFEPTGFNQSLAEFAPTNGTCTTPYGFGYIFPGSDVYDGTTVDCGPTNDNSGPESERGVVGFTKVNVTPSGGSTHEMMLVGTLKPNVSHLYYTQEFDNLLDYKQVAITGANGTNTASIQTMAASGEWVVISIPSDHGTNTPVINRFQATESGGVVTLGSVEDFTAKNIDYLGKASGDNPNPNKDRADGDVVGLDSMIFFNNALYMANNGGVVYLDNTSDRGSAGWDAASGSFPNGNDAKTAWTLSSPSTWNVLNNWTKWVSDKVDSGGCQGRRGRTG